MGTALFILALLLGAVAVSGGSGVQSLELETGDPGPDAPVVFWIPGAGQSPEQIDQIIQSLNTVNPISSRWIVPRAPSAGWFAEPTPDLKAELSSVMTGASFPSAIGAVNDAQLLALSRAAASLIPLVRAARSRFGRRPIVVGWDQGGSLALALSALYPEDVGMAIAMAGWLPRSQRVNFAEQSPHTISFHGDSDAETPLALGFYASEWLGANHRPVTWLPINGAGHSFYQLAPLAWDLLRAELGQS